MDHALSGKEPELISPSWPLASTTLSKRASNNLSRSFGIQRAPFPFAISIFVANFWGPILLIMKGLEVDGVSWPDQTLYNYNFVSVKLVRVFQLLIQCGLLSLINVTSITLAEDGRRWIRQLDASSYSVHSRLSSSESAVAQRSG